MPGKRLFTVLIFSVELSVCLVLLVLFSIITVKSHCCDRQYSRKQRIFLYLLLATLGDSIATLYKVNSGSDDSLLYMCLVFLKLMFHIMFCWATFYLCFEVFTTLRRTEFRCLRFRFHTVVEELCILIVVIAITAGWVAVYSVAHDNNIVLSFLFVFLPLVILSIIDVVSVALVLVQLCVAYRRVEGGQVANRLRRPAVVTVTLLVFLFFYIIGLSVLESSELSGEAGDTWFVVDVIVYIIGYKIIPYMFVIFFGSEMLQELGRQCCSRQYRRYEHIPDEEERGVLSVALSTTRTYCTCDAAGTTRTYYTCDESQPPEWFQAIPAPDTPVQ